MKSFIKKQPYIILGIIAIFIGVVVFLFSYFFLKQEKITSFAEKGTLIRSVSVKGDVVSEADYTLSFSTEGEIDAIFVWPGKKVSKGDLLVTLSNSKERADYKKAQDILLKAQDKYRKITSSSTQVLQEDVDGALADIVFAQAGAEGARAALEKTRVRAPIDSVVVSSLAFVGKKVSPDISIVTLRDNSNQYIVANLDDSESIFVSAGQDVLSTINGENYKGILTGIFKQNEGYKITSILPKKIEYNEEGSVDVRIITAQIENALYIPKDALLESSEGYSLEVVYGEKKTKKVFVEIGLTGDDNKIQILNGLSEGDRVVWEKDTPKEIE